MVKIKALMILICLTLLYNCKEDHVDDQDSEVEMLSSFDVSKVVVANTSGEIPKKGDEIVIKITVKNTGNIKSKVSLTPKISSKRFEDYNNISLSPVDVILDVGEISEITINSGPFIYDEVKKKHYALGRGDYIVNSITINENSDTNFEGKEFSIAASNAILVPVIYNNAYLSKLSYIKGIDSYLSSAFTREVEVYNNGDFVSFPGGMDEMMNVKHIFYPLAGENVSDNPAEGGTCEKAIALGGSMLGLGHDWEGPNVGTQKGNHGFDYLTVLTPDSFGGVTCGWINVQVSGMFDFDLSLNRTQIILVHESGHILGSPHCDPLKGYVMCSGELHEKYIDSGVYVFHIDSRNQMSNRFD